MYLGVESFVTDVEAATERKGYILQLKSCFKVTSCFP